MQSKLKLLFGSNNRHKAIEINEIINLQLSSNIELILPSDISKLKIDIEETGSTLEENAYLKASGFYNIAQIPCIADDTGLFIEALNGEPGIDAAIYAGEHGNDEKNRYKVLQLLKDVPIKNRNAFFRTVICYYDGKQVYYFEGICKGRIIEEESGTNGFGYDPIFIPDGFEKTFAEMNDFEKNSISHRAKAIENLAFFLKSNLYAEESVDKLN